MIRNEDSGSPEEYKIQINRDNVDDVSDHKEKVASHLGKAGEAATSKNTCNDDQVDSNPTAYESAYTISVIHHFYLLRDFCKLRKKKPTEPLKLEDLPLLGKTEEINHKILKLEAEFQRYRAIKKEPSIFWPVLRVFWRRMFKGQFVSDE